MTDALRLVGLGEAQVMASMLVLARIGPLFALAPVFGSKMIPKRVRALLAVALAFGLAPVLAPDARVPRGVPELALVIAGEVVVGLAFAFAVAILFAAVQAAGTFIDTLIGFGFGATVDPLTGTQSAVLGNAYALFAAIIFLAIGGEQWLFQGFGRTFDLLPAGTAPDLQALAAGAREVFTGIFLAALQVAAPVLVAIILTDVAMGIVSRAVPQLNVFMVGFPFKIVAGMFVLIASLPFAGGWIGDQVQATINDAMRVVAGGA
jgi:flagellar biosynthesis protein FliR